MAFESTAEDVKDFFTAEQLTVTNVRMVSGFDGKSKGFCYAEFPEAEMLKHALSMGGAQLGGRTVRISVAEPRESIRNTRRGAEGPELDMAHRKLARNTSDTSSHVFFRF